MWPHGNRRVVFTLSHWPRAMRWSADRNDEINFETRLRTEFWPVLGSFLGPFGSGLGVRVGLGVGLGLRPHLDPTRKCFLARKREQSISPKIRATRSLGKLSIPPHPLKKKKKNVFGDYRKESVPQEHAKKRKTEPQSQKSQSKKKKNRSVIISARIEKMACFLPNFVSLGFSNPFPPPAPSQKGCVVNGQMIKASKT